MKENRRTILMLVTVLVLAGANFYVRFTDGGVDAGAFFQGITNLESSWSPKLKKDMEDIESMPELSFRMKKEMEVDLEDARNPFIFGVDRVREEEQKRRMEELAEARAQIIEKEKIESVEETPAPVVVKATFPGKILGIMEGASSGNVVVSVVYQEQYHALRPGDVLDESYKLVSASQEHVRILALESSQEINIQLETP